MVAPRMVEVPEGWLAPRGVYIANAATPSATHARLEFAELTIAPPCDYYFALNDPAIHLSQKQNETLSRFLYEEPELDPWALAPDTNPSAVARDTDTDTLRAYHEARRPRWQRDARDADFWRFVVRGAPNACWGWKGQRSNGTPAYNAGGCSRNAARHGWGLVHGVLPEGRAVRHACTTSGCMNPRHWCLGKELATGHEKDPRPTPRELARLRMLYAAGTNPMRVLAATLGIKERAAWQALGVTDARLEEQRINAALAIQDAEERAEARAARRGEAIRTTADRAALATQQRAERAAADAMIAEAAAAQRALRARDVVCPCAACGADAPVDAWVTEDELVEYTPEGFLFRARTTVACARCGAAREQAYDWVVVPPPRVRAHLVGHHALRPDVAVEAVARPRGAGWEHGIQVQLAGHCVCGGTVAWSQRRWAIGEAAKHKAARTLAERLRQEGDAR